MADAPGKAVIRWARWPRILLQQHDADRGVVRSGSRAKVIHPVAPAASGVGPGLSVEVPKDTVTQRRSRVQAGIQRGAVSGALLHVFAPHVVANHVAE